LSSIFGSFFSWWGAFALAALDSSVFVFSPMGPDALVVYLASRNPERFWLYALLSAAGSTCGAAITYWMGRRAGESGLARFVRDRQLERIKGRVTRAGALPVALTAALPPPFPLTAFVLTCGALEVPWPRLLSVFAAVRAIRFGAESLLARRYGSAVLRLIDPRAAGIALAAVVVLVGAGTLVAIVPILRSRWARQSRATVA
jgi:undecaprenyl-diphosphatase